MVSDLEIIEVNHGQVMVNIHCFRRTILYNKKIKKRKSFRLNAIYKMILLINFNSTKFIFKVDFTIFPKKCYNHWTKIIFADHINEMNF